MRSLPLTDLIQVLKPKVIGEPPLQFTGIGTDTRKDLSGQLFWALKGESHDGHDFLEQAKAQGAVAALVHRVPPGSHERGEGLALLKVNDSLQALQKLATYYRRQSGAWVVGITGSNGKTSTKEFAAQILSGLRKVHWNPGSFNNHFGLPFNLLQTPSGTQVILAEMGMNHAGEIARLCEIAEPSAVVCTMVGTSHIENLGSVENIAKAKEEIYENAPAAAIRLYNLSNPWTLKMWETGRAKGWTCRAFSVNEDHRDAEVFLKAVGEGISGLKIEGRILKESLSLEIPILGAHQVTNLAAAALVALSAGLAPKEVIENLGRMKSPWGRMQLLKSQKGFRILFDGYNANPESMGALLSAVSSLKPTGKLCGVLAHMRELGDHAEAAHAELGRQAAALNFAKLWFYGPQNMAFRAGYLKAGGNEKNLVISDDYKDELAREMVFMLSPQDLVIVKGSRGLKTERFVLAADPLDFANK